MTKVLYIAGVPHSGSTIVSQVLGEVDGLVAVGESYYLWDAVERGMDCGCGRRLGECPWWHGVLESAFPDRIGLSALRPDRYYMALQALPASALRVRPSYRAALGSMLAAVAAHAEARVVVEASKSPTYARILDGIPGIDLHILHLVRSPQAIANSWSRFEGEAGRPGRHALLWLSWNAAIEALWAHRRGRYLRVRYEDFAARPRETIAAIVRFVGEASPPLPFVSDGAVRLETAHSVAGNPVRFLTGEVPIRVDDAWRERYPVRDRRVLEPLTWPLRVRYGY